MSAPVLVSTTAEIGTFVFPSYPSGYDCSYGAYFAVYVYTSPTATSGHVGDSSWGWRCEGQGDYWGQTRGVGGLQQGTTYYARAYLRDVFGEETWSTATAFTTLVAGG